MPHAFFLGIDTVATKDSASADVTIALIEKSKEGNEEPLYRLDHSRRHSTDPSPDALADRVQSLVAERPYIGRTSPIVNCGTEGGRALFDALEDRGLTPVAVALTGDAKDPADAPDNTDVRLTHSEVVQVLATLYLEDRLLFEEHVTESASDLARDLQAVAEELDQTLRQPEGAEQTTPTLSVGPSDTHLTSAALAAWLGTERSFDPSQRLKETPQTDPSSTEDLDR